MKPASDLRTADGPSGEQPQDFRALRRRKFGWPAHMATALAGEGPALRRPRSNQVALELGKAAEDADKQPTVGRRRIRPRVCQGAEAGALLLDGGEDVEEVPRRASQTVETANQDDVTWPEATDEPP